MTENEAKEFLERFSLDRIGYATGKEVDTERFDYFTNVLKTAIEALEEIQQYRSIGTVSECREAAEKQRAKKPIKYGDAKQGLDNNGNSISIQKDCYECPACDSFLGYVSDCKDEKYQDSYCRDCGQAIDWSDA